MPNSPKVRHRDDTWWGKLGAGDSPTGIQVYLILMTRSHRE